MQATTMTATTDTSNVASAPSTQGHPEEIPTAGGKKKRPRDEPKKTSSPMEHGRHEQPRAFIHSAAPRCPQCPPERLPMCCPHNPVGGVIVSSEHNSLTNPVQDKVQVQHVFQFFLFDTLVNKGDVILLPMNASFQPSTTRQTYLKALLVGCGKNSALFRYGDQSHELLSELTLTRLCSQNMAGSDDVTMLMELWNDLVYQKSVVSEDHVVSLRNRAALDAVEEAKASRVFSLVEERYMSSTDTMRTTMTALVDNLDLPNAAAAIGRKSELFVNCAYAFFESQARLESCEGFCKQLRESWTAEEEEEEEDYYY